MKEAILKRGKIIYQDIDGQFLGKLVLQRIVDELYEEDGIKVTRQRVQQNIDSALNKLRKKPQVWRLIKEYFEFLNEQGFSRLKNEFIVGKQIGRYK